VTNPTSATTQVAHFDFIALAATATEAAVEELIAEAAALKTLPSVHLVGVIRALTSPATSETASSETSPSPKSERGPGDEVLAPMPGVSTPGTAEPQPVGALLSSPTFDLAFFFVLDSFTALEPFGTHPQYIRFLQGKVARLLRGFAGTDVALTAPFPAGLDQAGACLALAAPDETYDWEVRAALDAWASDALPSSTGGAAAVGLAIGERQRYRGCVLCFTTSPQPFQPLADRRFESTLIAGRAERL
jgi:hypothetical protein